MSAWKKNRLIRSVLGTLAAGVTVLSVATGASAFGAWGAWTNTAGSLATCNYGGNCGECHKPSTGWGYFAGTGNKLLGAITPSESDSGTANWFSKTQARGYPFVNGTNPIVTACWNITGSGCSPTNANNTATKTTPIAMTHAQCRLEAQNTLW